MGARAAHGVWGNASCHPQHRVVLVGGYRAGSVSRVHDGVFVPFFIPAVVLNPSWAALSFYLIKKKLFWVTFSIYQKLLKENAAGLAITPPPLC